MFEDGAAHAQSDPADDRAHTGYEKGDAHVLEYEAQSLPCSSPLANSRLPLGSA